MKTRSVVFTLFGVEPEDEFRHFMSEFKAKYWAAGSEHCPTTKRQHWQGWMQFANPRSMAPLLKAFFGKGHVEVRKGTVDDNTLYCGKEGVLIEEGERPTQGQRSDIETALTRKSLREHFAKDHPNWQSIRCLEKRIECVDSPIIRDEKPTQSSVSCDTFREMACDMADYFLFTGEWWGYDGQHTLVVANAGAHTFGSIERGIPIRVKTGGTSRYTDVKRILYLF